MSARPSLVYDLPTAASNGRGSPSLGSDRPAAPRRARALVVLIDGARSAAGPALALAASLGEIGIETVYLGREESPARIAAAVRSERADGVELFVGGEGVVKLLRELLRELIGAGRRDVRVVIHRTG